MKNCPGKKPAFQFYVMDWLSDIRLMKSTHSTQGIWIKLLCYMWLEQIYEITLDRDQFHRIGAADDEIDQFIADAEKHKFCEIRLENKTTFHVLSRRFQREHEQRAKWRKYKQKPSAPSKADKPDPIAFQEDSTTFPPVSSSSSSRKKDFLDKSKKSGRPPAAPTPLIETLDEINKEILGKKNRHFEHHVGEFFKSIKGSCDKIQSKNGHKFNPFQWIQVKVNDKAHPQAIAEALEALLKYWNTTDNPWGYADKIYKTLKQKFSEADAIAYHEAMKQQTAEISKILGINIFKEV